MRVILLGSPGVGKGTYTKFLVDNYKLPHISTGDLLREALKQKTQVGKDAEQFMKEGKLVPDELIIKLLKDRIKKTDCKNGFFLDGFPRNKAQAQMLDKITSHDVVLNFEAPNEVIVDRLSGRITCKSCQKPYHKRNIPPKKEGICDDCGGELYQRPDDKVASIKQRLDVYENQTKPLKEHFAKKGTLKKIDASSPIEESHKVMIQLYEALGPARGINSTQRLANKLRNSIDKMSRKDKTAAKKAYVEARTTLKALAKKLKLE